jgi:hypothetical protein
MKVIGEILAYTLFAIVVGVLSVWPRYELLADGQALVSIAFVHAGERVGECRRLTQEELNALPPNMRKPSECPRERHPLRVELRSGTKLLYSDVLLPSGLWSDGKSNVYQRIVIAAGRHDLFVGMNESGGEKGFDYEQSVTIDVAAHRNIVIRFDEKNQKFDIR